MAKKMHDILPPRAKRKVAKVPKELEKDIKSLRSSMQNTAKEGPKVKYEPLAPVKDVPLQPLPTIKKEKRFPLREILVGGAVVVFLLCIYGFVKLPKAEIQIWPKTETITLNEVLVADASATGISLDLKSIPAQYVEISKDASQDFSATGSASNDGQAVGTIKIYNKINPSSSFTLVKGTHFLSDSGKYFVSTQRITIPGSSSGTPGFISVPVQAEESGESYNIGASKFSLPKLSGTAYYYSIYGESTSPMTGGYAGKVKKVTEDDLQSAKEVLVKQLLVQAEDSLKSKLSSGDILLDGAISSHTIDSSASVKSGTITDTFTQKASVKASALVFKKQDLDNFMKSSISSEVPETKNYLEKSLVLTFTPRSIDVSGKKETIDITGSVKTYYRINTIELVDLFAAKSGDEIKKVVDQKYSGKISKLKVNFWPFWVTSAPSSKNRINVSLNF